MTTDNSPAGNSDDSQPSTEETVLSAAQNLLPEVFKSTPDTNNTTDTTDTTASSSQSFFSNTLFPFIRTAIKTIFKKVMALPILLFLIIIALLSPYLALIFIIGVLYAIWHVWTELAISSNYQLLLTFALFLSIFPLLMLAGAIDEEFND